MNAIASYSTFNFINKYVQERNSLKMLVENIVNILLDIILLL